MGGRPAYAAAMLDSTGTAKKKGKSTQAFREQEEKKTLTGDPMTEYPETKADPIAHKRFLRTRQTLDQIGRNDKAYEAAINHYAMLLADVAHYNEAARQAEAIGAVDQMIKFDTMKIKAIAQATTIAKENCMTVQGALRVVPKKPPADMKDPLIEALSII